MPLSTTVRLHKDIPIADGLQIAFQSVAQQQNYFFSAAHTAMQVDAVVYLKYTSGEVTIVGRGEQILQAGYLSFQNRDFDDKTYYCRILSHEQVTESTVRITFVIDWWQTMMFDAQYRSMMIEREHISAEDAYNLENGATPAAMNIIEFVTTEDLPTTRDLEVNYKDRPVVLRISSEVGQTEWDVPGWTGGVNTVGGPLRGATADEALPGWEGTEGASLAVNVPWDGEITLGSQTVNSTAASYLLTFSVSNAMFQDQDDRPALLPDRTGSIINSGALDELLNELSNELSNITANARYIYDVGGLIVGVSISATEAYLTSTDAMSEAAGRTIDLLTEYGFGDSILGLVAIPQVVNYAQQIIFDAPMKSYGDLVGYEPASHKLYRAPFRMVRLVSPTGEEHTLALESFSEAGAKPPQFLWAARPAPEPSMDVIPLNYDGEALSSVHRMSYGGFVSLPYTTDAYLTWYASALQDRLSSMSSLDRFQTEQVRNGNPFARANLATNDFSQQIGKGASLVPGLGGILSGAGNLLGLNSQTAGAIGSLVNPSGAQYDPREQAEIDQAALYGSGDPATSPLAQQRNAHVMDNYHAGDASNQFSLQYNQYYFRLEVTTLRREILQAYDHYFLCFGYRSQRLGIPRVLSWTRGGQGADAPQFVNFDGMRFTYVQTTSAKVYGIYKPAADQIAGMLNAGVRMIDGSSL